MNENQADAATVEGQAITSAQPSLPLTQIVDYATPPTCDVPGNSPAQDGAIVIGDAAQNAGAQPPVEIVDGSPLRADITYVLNQEKALDAALVDFHNLCSTLKDLATQLHMRRKELTKHVSRLKKADHRILIKTERTGREVEQIEKNRRATQEVGRKKEGGK